VKLLARRRDSFASGRATIAALVAVGVCLRLAAFLENRSLWLDEAMLARNVVNRSFHQLAEPLSYNQGAPLGYLALSKLSVLALGPNEYALRMVSILASLTALLVFASLASKCFEGAGRVGACALFALCGSLIHFAAEAKQYSSDVFVAVLLLYFGLRAIRTGSRPAYFSVAATGIVGVWVSHPSVFVLATIGLWLLWRAVRSRDPRQSIAPVLLCVAWLASFSVVYLVNLRFLSGNDVLQTYWSDRFVPLSPVEAVRWSWNSGWELFVEPFQTPAGYFVAWLFVVGLVGLCVNKRELAWLSAGPCLLVLLAALMRLYPFGGFGGRLILFALPGVILGCAAGWEQMAAVGKWVGGTLAVAILLPMADDAIHLRKSEGEELRPLMKQLVEQSRPGDRVYVYVGAGPAFSFYAEDVAYLKGRGLDITNGTVRQGDTVEYERELSPLSGASRVWIVYSHDRWRRLSDEEVLLSAARHLGQEIHTFRAAGAAIYLFEFDR
jgi:Dolichyl-phosphate-mannose-protein mannosyltransferase